MTLEGYKISPSSHTVPTNFQHNSGLSRDYLHRASPALIAPEPEDDSSASGNMTSIAEALVKMDAISTSKSNSEALSNDASDDDDDDDDDSGDDPKQKGKKSSLKSRRELPAGAVTTLKQWLLSPEHFTHPYPTPQDQIMLMQKTGIDKKQLKNWFTNARRRIWKPMLKKQLEQGKIPDAAVVSNGNLNNSSSEGAISAQQVRVAPVVSSESATGEDQSQQQHHQYTWQGQQQYGDTSQGNLPQSPYTYMAQFPSSQHNDQQQIYHMNTSNSIGSLPQISRSGSTGMLKTDSHAVLMELFARDQDLVRQAAKGAKLKAQAVAKSVVQTLGQSSVHNGGSGYIMQSTKMAQTASVPSMNSWPHFSSVSSLNNLGSLAGVKSIHNLSGADLVSHTNKRGSLPNIKSQENMGRADSYAFLEVFFDNSAMSGRGTKRERDEDNDVGLSLDADESPMYSKPMDVISSVTRPAPLPVGEIDENEELKRNYDDALAARGLLSVSRSSEKLTDLPMKMQRTLSQEFLRQQFGGSNLQSFCSFASWGQTQNLLPWDVPQVIRHPGEELLLNDTGSNQDQTFYQPYQIPAEHAPAPTPMSDPSMTNASVEVPASTRCALCHQTNVDTQLRPCGHMFHGRCLKPSLQNAMGPPTCPIDHIPMLSAVLAVPADGCQDHLRGVDIRGDLQSYIKEKDLTPLLTNLLESLLIDKPDNPIGHIVQQLVTLYPEETKQFNVQLKNKTGNIPVLISQACTDDDSATTEHTGSTLEDVPSGKRRQLVRRSTFPALVNSRRRSSISAERINFALVTKPEFKIAPKTNEEAERIQHILTKTENVLFRGLDKVQLVAIQNAMFLVEKADGDVIIAQGDVGDNFYIIDKGSVNAFVKNAVSMDPPGALVKQYGEGDSFGELAIMYNAPRAATCIATSPAVRLWALDRFSFKLILVQNTLSRQMEYTGFLKQVPSFAQLTEYELLTVADALEEKIFKENEVVCTEGDTGDSFFIIREGIAICTQKDSSGNIQEVARLSRGSYFGEIALSQVTVTSFDHLRCLKVDRKTFQRVMGPLTNFLKRNTEEYVKIQAANI